jgi:hypothetical protein
VKYLRLLGGSPRIHAGEFGFQAERQRGMIALGL